MNKLIHDKINKLLEEVKPVIDTQGLEPEFYIKNISKNKLKDISKENFARNNTIKQSLGNAAFGGVLGMLLGTGVGAINIATSNHPDVGDFQLPKLEGFGLGALAGGIYGASHYPDNKVLNTLAKQRLAELKKEKK
jgi:hypothetical protein